MPVRKSVRFNVFARDGFTCQYCGKRPPEVVLECDHIHPQSKGGSDDEINLITSCADCNRGKSAKVIADVAPRPDADFKLLKVQQEMVEVRRYLEAKAERDALEAQLCDALQKTWWENLTPATAPANCVLLPWIRKYGAEEIEKAIFATVPGYLSDRFGRPTDSRVFKNLIPYVGAILRNRKAEREDAG